MVEAKQKESQRMTARYFVLLGSGANGFPIGICGESLVDFTHSLSYDSLQLTSAASSIEFTLLHSYPRVPYDGSPKFSISLWRYPII